MVQKANSGHPGLPMGAADMAFVLWTRHLTLQPARSALADRDRFVLSAGHGSMLLYSLLHLAGYDLHARGAEAVPPVGLADAGPPGVRHPPGVEVTTGPLGQGFANGVGMAIAAGHARGPLGRGNPVVDHFIYAIVSDGDLMEGVSAEAASLRRPPRSSGNLIYLYDDNQHHHRRQDRPRLHGEDVAKRFEAYGWHVQRGRRPRPRRPSARAIEAAKADPRPSLIRGQHAHRLRRPNKADTPGVHGEPLGEEELKATKEALGWPLEPRFFVPDDVRAFWRRASWPSGRCTTRLARAGRRRGAPATPSSRRCSTRHVARWVPAAHPGPAASRPARTPTPPASSPAGAINRAAPLVPSLVGGYADLAASNTPTSRTPAVLAGEAVTAATSTSASASTPWARSPTAWRSTAASSPSPPPSCTFADYMRPAIRLAALASSSRIYVFTHDSIFLGEDGPTHQPVEHLAALRVIPNLDVVRPADGEEMAVAWAHALTRRDGPTALVLTRQKLAPVQRDGRLRPREGGARRLRGARGAGGARFTVIATGSEVPLAQAALAAAGEQGLHGPARLDAVPGVLRGPGRGLARRGVPPGLPIAAVEAAVRRSSGGSWIGARRPGHRHRPLRRQRAGEGAGRGVRLHAGQGGRAARGLALDPGLTVALTPRLRRAKVRAGWTPLPRPSRLPLTGAALLGAPPGRLRRRRVLARHGTGRPGLGGDRVPPFPGGMIASGTVTLDSFAGADVVVALAGSGGPASLPATATVAAGDRTVTFQVTTAVVTSPTVATISATYAGRTRTASSPWRRPAIPPPPSPSRWAPAPTPVDPAAWSAACTVTVHAASLGFRERLALLAVNADGPDAAAPSIALSGTSPFAAAAGAPLASALQASPGRRRGPASDLAALDAGRDLAAARRQEAMAPLRDRGPGRLRRAARPPGAGRRRRCRVAAYGGADVSFCVAKLTGTVRAPELPAATFRTSRAHALYYVTDDVWPSFPAVLGARAADFFTTLDDYFEGTSVGTRTSAGTKHIYPDAAGLLRPGERRRRNWPRHLPASPISGAPAAASPRGSSSATSTRTTCPRRTRPAPAAGSNGADMLYLLDPATFDAQGLPRTPRIADEEIPGHHGPRAPARRHLQRPLAGRASARPATVSRPRRRPVAQRGARPWSRRTWPASASHDGHRAELASAGTSRYYPGWSASRPGRPASPTTPTACTAGSTPSCAGSSTRPARPAPRRR